MINTAIFDLKHMLENANIPYQSFREAFCGFQLKLNKEIDAVQLNYQDGIEIWGALTEEETKNRGPEVLRTAEEVFKRFKYCFENDTSVYLKDIK